MQKIRLFILGLAITGLFITGCANPFSGGTSDVTDTYLAEFPDIPIPKDMGINESYTQISQIDNIRTGYLSFTGGVEGLSLIDAFLYNMHQQHWTPLAIYKSEHGLLVFQKDTRICVMTITDSFPNTLLRIWVSPKMSGFTVPPTVPPTPAPPVESEESYYEVEPLSDESGAGSGSSESEYSEVYSSSGSSNEQNLSE